MGLPAENCLLGLADGGQAIVACLWQSNRQNADLIVANDSSQSRIAGYEIELDKDQRMWMAVLEGANIWHSRQTTEQEVEAGIALEWMPPFAAKWRVTCAAGDGTARSWHFGDADQKGAFVQGAKLGGPGQSRLIVAYPIDRSRSTPLMVFCLVDVVRNALGVGPCQYVLDVEGVGLKDSPTPERVTRWVEKQLEKKKAKREADAIREQLGQMTLQAKRTESRIGEYGEFAREVRRLCTQQEQSEENRAAARKIAAVVDGMEAGVAAKRQGAPRPQIVENLAAQMGALVDKEDAAAECQALGAQIRAAGADQEYVLAKLRMGVRRLRQECRMIAVGDAKAGRFAAEIQQRAERMLGKRTTRTGAQD